VGGGGGGMGGGGGGGGGGGVEGGCWSERLFKCNAIYH